jgi:GNAT superfamily N-acetyltransferase
MGTLSIVNDTIFCPSWQIDFWLFLVYCFNMSNGSVSEVYQPPSPQLIQDAPVSEHYHAWGYRIGYVVDGTGQSVPESGNTAVFRIFPHGMTEPVFVTKPEEGATFTVNVLSGTGKLIKVSTSDEVEEVSLSKGSEVVIRPGEAYVYQNTSDDTDLMLHDVALPTFRSGDDVELTSSSLVPPKPQPRAGYSSCVAVTPEGGTKIIELPTRFYELVGGAATEHIINQGRITLRHIRPDDVEQLRPILEQWVRDSNTGALLPQEVEDILSFVSSSIEGSNDRTYVVAENEENKLVGVMGMTLPETDLLQYATTQKPVELVNAFVDQASRRNKIGDRLANRLEDIALQTGFTEVIVTSGPRYQKSGWPFWTKLYGEPVAIQEDYFGPGNDAPVWRKSLVIHN